MLDLKFGITNDLNRLMHRYILVHHQYPQDSGDLEFRGLQYFPFLIFNCYTLDSLTFDHAHVFATVSSFTLQKHHILYKKSRIKLCTIYDLYKC